MVILALLTLATCATQVDGSKLDDLRELTELVCIDCHMGSTESGAGTAARLDLVAALDAPAEHLELLTTAFAQVRQGFMPPSDAPGGGFDDEERREWLGGLRALVQSSDMGPGHATLRRMTRRQVKRTLQQLFGIDVPVERFLPRDASGYGFDTTGDTLFVTPLYYESWYECVEFVVAALLAKDPKAAASAVDAERVRAFLRLAFSDEPSGSSVAARLELAQAEDGDGWLDVVRATLLSQEFLYRVEGEGSSDQEPETGTVERIDAYAMASRLSFFLHGSRPDEALLHRAGSHEFDSDASVASIVQEMLDDPRSRSLAEDFAAQWLGTSELRDVTPDVRRYSAFNEGLRKSMGLEVVEFFDDLVRQNRSVLECLDSEYVFVDRRLAKHYGMAEVKHRELRRLPRESVDRGGVLGMAGILTVTSNPLRTSPVKRGQWVLERIFHAPAPPPPPNVGTLPEDDQQKDGLSLAERLATHRARASCSACHDQMDPWGLALERFDGIGQWRELELPAEGDPAEGEPEGNREEGVATESIVKLPNGWEVPGPAGMKASLIAEPERFIEAFSSALFTYAVGRPPTLVDLQEIEAIMGLCIADGYRVRTLIQGIALCTAMTHRQG
ncbi:MAG: hypothetical protein ACJA0P_003535 [Planctomycetota bacterium]|jgi:hypothetical protein